jgi:pyridoxal phosphate enzyme (YggS family)
LTTAVLSAQTIPEPPLPTLHLTSQLVVFDATVELRKNHTRVAGLTPEDFLLFEDKHPETVTSVSEDTLPLSVTLLIDSTDTVRPVLLPLADGALQLLSHLKPEDEVAVATFSSNLSLLQDFTTDRSLAAAAILKAAKRPRDSDATFIHEDVWEAAQLSTHTTLPTARRVQLWLTDGTANLETPENISQHGLHAPRRLHLSNEALQELLRSNAVVAPLIETSALASFPFSSENSRMGDLERYAELTGGPIAHSDGDEVEPLLAAQIDTLRQRYTLAYKPTQPRKPGALCRLHLELSPLFYFTHPNLKPRDILIRTRESYIRNPQSTLEKTTSHHEGAVEAPGPSSLVPASMSIAENLHQIRTQIAEACARANRPVEDVALMAVSKVHPVEALLEAYAAGQRLFGENRVQEWQQKSEAAAHLEDLEMHLIGPLQSNKTTPAARLFHAIDTVDSLRIASRLNDAARALAKILPILIEVKLSPEESKHGLAPQDLPSLLDSLKPLESLRVSGLMTVAPWPQDLANAGEEARPYFRELRRLRDENRPSTPTLTQLSIGMSNDFAAAIEEGSTCVRIGTAIFGQRKPS